MEGVAVRRVNVGIGAYPDFRCDTKEIAQAGGITEHGVGWGKGRTATCLIAAKLCTQGIAGARFARKLLAV
jgi:hypothetical protein